MICKNCSIRYDIIMIIGKETLINKKKLCKYCPSCGYTKDIKKRLGI